MKKNKIKTGFTLVEVLVALFIIVMVIGAAVQAEVTNIRSADETKQRLQATGLSQEALNAVRNKRDTYVLSHLDPNNPPDGFTEMTGINYCLNLNSSDLIAVPIGSPPDINCTNQKVQLGNDQYSVKITIE